MTSELPPFAQHFARQIAREAVALLKRSPNVRPTTEPDREQPPAERRVAARAVEPALAERSR